MSSLAATRSAELARPPPPGAPYSVALEGSEKEGRSQVYRHWRFKDAILESLDPTVATAHDFFEQTAERFRTNRCLGHRPYDPVTKTFGPYVWETYGQIHERRKNFGIGISQLHKKIGITGKQYGVGLWCQNRPEWQIVGELLFNVRTYQIVADRCQIWVACHSPCTPCPFTTPLVLRQPNTLSITPR